MSVSLQAVYPMDKLPKEQVEDSRSEACTHASPHEKPLVIYPPLVPPPSITLSQGILLKLMMINPN